MNELKRLKIVTAVSAALVAGLLTVSICTVAMTPGAKAQPDSTPASDTSGGNTIDIQVDPDVYEGIMAMLDYYRTHADEPTGSGATEPEQAVIVQAGDTFYVVVGDKSYPITGDGTPDGNPVEIVETADGLYVIVDGKLYKLITPDGTTLPDDVQGGSGNDDATGGGADGDDDPGEQPGTQTPGFLGYDDKGNPIVAYDPDGRPIIGYNEDGTPIYGYSDPQIRVDANGVKYFHVIWGDTLCGISSRVHFSVQELAEYNHIRNVNLIYAESDLRIPPYEPWTEAPDAPFIPAETNPDTGDDEEHADVPELGNVDENPNTGDPSML